jgi:hypothetical protein
MKLQRFFPIAATATLLASITFLTFAQTEQDHDFEGGYLTHQIDIPDGCTEITYEVLDWDPLLNDVLMKKKTVTPDGPFHLLNMKWICFDGEVLGPDGGSGESECSAFVRVTYTIGTGEEATSYTKDSGYYVLTCH